MSLFRLKSRDLDFSKGSTHAILKHRYVEFDDSLVRYLTTRTFLK